jgi:hypothetical protein
MVSQKNQATDSFFSLQISQPYKAKNTRQTNTPPYRTYGFLFMVTSIEILKLMKFRSTKRQLTFYKPNQFYTLNIPNIVGNKEITVLFSLKDSILTNLKIYSHFSQSRYNKIIKIKYALAHHPQKS